MQSIGVDHLRSIASYCPETGIVTWLRRSPSTFRNGGAYAEAISDRWNKNMAGTEVGNVNSHGYVVTCVEKKTVMVHRMAWAIHFGKWPDGQIDHINGDPSDNRIENLRDVSVSENALNRKYHRAGQLKFSHKRTTVVKGKSYTYFASVVRGKYLGGFKTREEAHACSMRFIENGGTIQ